MPDNSINTFFFEWKSYFQIDAENFNIKFWVVFKIFQAINSPKWADQPAHLRSLLSTFVICFWKVSYLDLLQVKFQFSS